jgi:hypothetical protein
MHIHIHCIHIHMHIHMHCIGIRSYIKSCKKGGDCVRARSSRGSSRAYIRYLSIYVCVHIGMCAVLHVHFCSHTCLCTYIHAYVRTHSVWSDHDVSKPHIRRFVPIQTCIHTYIHTYAHTYSGWSDNDVDHLYV